MRKRSLICLLVLLTMGWVILFANLSLAGTVDLPKTGQTTCYDTAGNLIPCAGTGQDGDIQAGVAWPAPRFTDNGDGTITDNLTGLMWLKDANCFGYYMTWQEALDKVADLNANPGSYSCGGYTGTYTDWALANVNELESLFNAEEPNQTVWLNEQGFTGVQQTFYWSSTSCKSDSGVSAHIVGMYNADSGILTSAGKNERNYCVWPVRAATTPPTAVWKTGQTQSYAAGDDGDLQRGVAWPAPRFTDKGDGTVIDNLTGLMWLKDALCFLSDMTWKDALDKVADLNANPGRYSCGGYAAAYTDWRMPNRKELHSLTDFSQYAPALPAEHPFSNVQLNYYWTSTTPLYVKYDAFDLSMESGSIRRSNKPHYYYLWPVRTAPSVLALDIRANGSDGPITVSPSTPVAIDISLDPGDKAGKIADWWIAVQTPFAPPGDWYSYIHPAGWMPGLNMCAQTALFKLTPFTLLNMVLPSGAYTFYFGVDDPKQSIFGPWWGLDSVEVTVE